MPKKTQKLTDYDSVIADVFQHLHASQPTATVLEFTKANIEQAVAKLFTAKAIRRPTKNIPDIRGTYDARRPFPATIAAHGHWAIIGRGKGLYSFVTLPQDNLIDVPGSLPAPPVQKTLPDKTPALVLNVLGKDEQAMMTRLRYSDVIRDFTGLSAVHHVQGHHRTTISAGQIEVDEVYVGRDAAQKNFVIPISGKGGEDKLSYTQAHNLNLYAAEKPGYKGLTPVPLGIVNKDGDSFVVVEFSVDSTIQNIRIVRSAVYKLT